MIGKAVCIIFAAVNYECLINNQIVGAMTKKSKMLITPNNTKYNINRPGVAGEPGMFYEHPHLLLIGRNIQINKNTLFFILLYN